MTGRPLPVVLAGSDILLVNDNSSSVFTVAVHSIHKLEMWANAQRDGRPAEHRWRPLSNACKVWLTPNTRCRAVTMPRRETR